MLKQVGKRRRVMATAMASSCQSCSRLFLKKEHGHCGTPDYYSGYCEKPERHRFISFAKLDKKLYFAYRMQAFEDKVLIPSDCPFSLEITLSQEKAHEDKIKYEAENRSLQKM